MYREAGSKWYSDKRWNWNLNLYIQAPLNAASNLSPGRVRSVLCSATINFAKIFRFNFSQYFCVSPSYDGFICLFPYYMMGSRKFQLYIFFHLFRNLFSILDFFTKRNARAPHLFLIFKAQFSSYRLERGTCFPITIRWKPWGCRLESPLSITRAPIRTGNPCHPDENKFTTRSQ